MSLLGGSIAAQQPPAGAEPTRPSPISETELVRRIAGSVDSLAKTGEFSGVAVLAKNGVPVFQRAYGMADRERGVANNLETAFNVGSINKVFTQIAILQLSAAGKINLDSTLAVYWPDYPNKTLANKITAFDIHAIKAQVYKATSWFDGQEAIILDYSRKSVVAHRIRDEIREVAPGLYLGQVFLGRARVLNFALTARNTAR